MTIKSIQTATLEEVSVSDKLYKALIDLEDWARMNQFTQDQESELEIIIAAIDFARSTSTPEGEPA